MPSSLSQHLIRSMTMELLQGTLTHKVGHVMANTTTTSTKEVNMLIFEGLPEKGNMICDEDVYPRKKKARDIC